MSIQCLYLQLLNTHYLLSNLTLFHLGNELLNFGLMLYSIFFIMKYQQFWQQLRLPLMFVYMYMCISVYVGQSYC